MFPLHQHVYTIHTHNLLTLPTQPTPPGRCRCIASNLNLLKYTSPHLDSPHLEHAQITLRPLLLVFSENSPQISRFPDDSPDYPDSKNIEILLFNQCTQTPCRLWQVEHYLHSSHHPLAGADGNRKDSKFTFSNSSQTHRYSYSQITARLITFWNFS